MIQLIAISNPFQPISSRTLYEVEWVEGITLDRVLSTAGVSPLRHGCVIDGLVVPEEMLSAFQVVDRAVVITMPSVRGGGGWEKMAAEIAVMVAAAAITQGFSLTMFGFTAAWTGIGGGATVQSLVAGAITIGGNMLVNAFMGGGGHGGADSASFDPTGPKTVASGGTAIPKGYGSFLSGGNIIASYVEAEGVNNYLNVLVSYGWGPATSITNVSINGNSISNYVNTTYLARYGTNNQTPIPNFNNIVNGYPQEVRCIAPAGGGTPVVVQGTGTATQGLQIVMQFPDGIFWQENDGSLRSLSVAYLVQYAISGTGAWQIPTIPWQTNNLIRFADDGTVTYAPGWVVIPNDGNAGSGCVYAYDNNMSPTAYTPGQPWSGTQTVTYFNADGSTYTGSISLTGEWQPCDPSLNQQLVTQWSSGYIIMTAANQGTLYQQVNIYNLPPNKYDIQVTKYGSAFSGDPIQPLEANNDRTGDQVWIHSVNEIQYQDLAYPNMILLGVQALATNQLSGANINITAQVEYGITATLPAALASYGTDNPAVVAYDMLVADFYGGGVDPANIDVPAFAAWAAYNDELVSDGFTGTIKRHVFNGVFDANGTNLWKSLQKVAMMAQACIVQVGQTYTVVVDQPVTVPAQVFTVGNIVRDSIKDTWLSFDDRANRIEVTFADSARNYRTDEPCAVMLPADIEAGVEVKTTRVQLLGCTNRAQAWHWAYRKLLSTDLLLLTRSFDVGIEAVACQVGSVVGVQDDVTGWANGGRIQAGSTTTSLIIDDSSLSFTAGEGWTVSIQHPVVVRGTGVIQSIVGNLITFTAALPSGNIVGIDNVSGALGVIQATGSNTVTVASAAGFTAGQTVTFFDEDVLDTQPVTAAENGVLTPAAPFLQTPTPDCPWVYGQSAGAFPAKLFTVTNIRKKNDFQVTIDCLQYDPAVYSDDTPIITETLGTPDTNAAVTNLTLNEQYVLASGANGGQASQIAVGWMNGPNTVATQIWVALADSNQILSAESLVQTVSKGSTCILSYPTGMTVQVRAVGVDGTGITAPFSTAPLETITVQGSGLAPGDVTGFTGFLSPTSVALSWSSATDAENYEIRYNADLNNSNWQTGALIYQGSALAYTDPTPRLGTYLIKALSSDSVESVNTASWNYLLGTARQNLVPLAPGQTVNVVVSSLTAGATSASVTITCPAQTLYRKDGSPLTIASSSLTLSGLALSTSYIIYPYLDQSLYDIHSGAGDTSVPDTSANPASAAAASAGTNYACTAISITTPGANGTSSSSATFQVAVRPIILRTGGNIHLYGYNVTGITVTSGGSGYTTVAGSLQGLVTYPSNPPTTSAHSEALTFTVSGGSITGVSGFNTNTLWSQPPSVVL